MLFYQRSISGEDNQGLVPTLECKPGAITSMRYGLGAILMISEDSSQFGNLTQLRQSVHILCGNSFLSTSVKPSFLKNSDWYVSTNTRVTWRSAAS